MLPVKQMFLTNKNRPGLKIMKLKGIAIHWTANLSKGADAVANRNYFNTTTRSASAHYIVDDHQIIQCIPDDEVAWHVGAKKYRAAGEHLMEQGRGPNFFLIGIEMCVNSDGDWNKTYNNTVELAASLIKKYKLTVNNLYRHYDITGKDCPKMMIDEGEWIKFKYRIDELLKSGNRTDETNQDTKDSQKFKTGIVNASSLNCRAEPSVSGKINGKLANGSRVTIYDEKNGWYLVNKVTPQWVSTKYITIL